MRRTLAKIHHNGQQRIKDKQSAWYKNSNYGKCPENDPGHSVLESYIKRFACLPTDTPDYRKKQSENAEVCASERMADMRHVVKSGLSADKGHIYPIKYAYSLGNHCLSLNGLQKDNDTFRLRFQQYYNELIEGTKGKSISQLFNKDDNILFDNYNISKTPEYKSFISSLSLKIHNKTLKNTKKSFHKSQPLSIKLHDSTSQDTMKNKKMNSNSNSNYNLLTITKKQKGGKGRFRPIS